MFDGAGDHSCAVERGVGEVRPFRYLSVCSGIEAASVAWSPLGWQLAGVAEIDPSCANLLSQRWGAGRPQFMPAPEAAAALEAKKRRAAIKAVARLPESGRIPNFGDLESYRRWDVGADVDLLVGGTPCQSFSVAGLRQGLDDPRGNPFLDLCLWKGRFPSRRAQFCTEFLKREAIDLMALGPALDRGSVVQWIGVRREESLNRRTAPMFRRVTVARGDLRRSVLFFQPIIHWTAANVFSFQRALGLQPNPLYLQGFGRVGCFPCINAGKQELAQIGRRYPEVVDRLVEWESLVKDASKRGAATFFASDVTPEGAALGAKARASGGLSPEVSAALPWPSADEVFAWARTNRGGDRRQGSMFDLLDADDGLSCTSQYGLCE